jgi:hypothetical protein
MIPALIQLKRQLIEHPLYEQLQSVEDVRYFMERHVYCVWDFMSLLKSLQQELTGNVLPWLPPADPQVARLINEIVLDEETDCIEGLGVMSHFDLYVQAMAEIGCETGPVETLIHCLREGQPLDTALLAAEVPEPSQVFLHNTFKVLQQPLLVRAMVFVYAREDVLPDMFVEMVRRLSHRGLPCQTLVAYLDRHIQADGEKHGPMAHTMVDQLAAATPELLPQALAMAEESMQARLQLWDAILQGRSAEAIPG